MAEIVASYWVNFAKLGDPNGPGLPPWPRYEREDGRVFELAPEIGVRTPQRAAQLRYLDECYKTALGSP